MTGRRNGNPNRNRWIALVLVNVLALASIGGLLYQRHKQAQADAVVNALMHRDTAAFRALITQGADPNAISSNWTPLGMAVVRGTDEDVRMLLSHGARPNYFGRAGEAPLTTASFYNRPGAVRQLLAAGANPRFLGEGRDTALYAAASLGHLEIVRLLLDAGADATVRETVRQETPADGAARMAVFYSHMSKQRETEAGRHDAKQRRQDCLDIIALLKAHGG